MAQLEPVGPKKNQVGQHGPIWPHKDLYGTHGIPEAVIDGDTGFIVSPGNTREMAKQITELANNRMMVKDMGQAARIHIEKNFSIAKHISILNQVLEDAVGDRLS